MLRALAGLIVIGSAGIPSFAQPAFEVQTLAGSNNAGDGGTALTAAIQQPEGIAVDASGMIYFADAADHRIRAISPAGEIRTIAGDGSPGSTGDDGPARDARLNSPYGLSLSRDGNLYVADFGNARIRMISPDGRIRTVAGGGGIPAGDSAEGSPATAIQFKTPRNVLADSNGGFYFSDFDAHRVYYVDFRGTLAIFAGTGNPGYGADGIPPKRSALRNPAGLAFEPLGGLIIVESGSQRLRRVARGTVTSYLSEAFRNYPLFSPTGIAFDTAGNLYIADARATGALKRTPQGEITALPVSGRAVAADPAGGVYYAWNAGIYRVDSSNRVTPAAGASGGIAELAGDGGTAVAARLLDPSGVAYDREGNLYIADERAHRVRRVTPAGLITTVAGTGKPSYGGDGGPATKAGLNAPRGLAFDLNGFLYVADSGNHAIRKISPSGMITSASGMGFRGFRGDGGPATAGLLSSPSAVAVDPNGEVYIADSGNHRVRRISHSGLLSTYAGTGVAGMAFEGASAVIAQLNDPRGLAFDVSGNLYIADSGNNRIRQVDVTGLLTTAGEPDFSSPAGIAIAGDGSIYVADTGKHRICRITGTGMVQRIAGLATPGFSGDGGMASDALFQFPSALVFDAGGNLAVADTGNGRVRQLRPVAGLISNETSGARVFNAASSVEGPAAPGMLATLMGDGFGPSNAASAPGGAVWPRLLGEVEVYIDGETAPLLYVSSRQINLQIPFSIAGRREVKISVFHRGQLRAETAIPVAAAVPGVFPPIIHPDGSVNGPRNPASRGGIVTLFGTGIGLLNPELAEIRIGSLPAQILWAGPAPGLPGIVQVNLRLPSGFFAPGSHPLVFRIGSQSAPGGVFVHLQ